MCYGIVYLLTCLLNGKHYVGQSTQGLEQRWNDALYNVAHNRRGGCVCLYRAIRKYGAENFTRRILATADNQKQLNTLEIEFIKQYDSQKNGYNIRDGGLGGKLAAKTKRKLAHIHQQRWVLGLNPLQRPGVKNHFKDTPGAASAARAKACTITPALNASRSVKQKGISKPARKGISPTNMIDLTGQTFGHWFVISRGSNANNGKTRWHCRCSCGTERLISGQSLTRSLSRSCGQHHTQ